MTILDYSRCFTPLLFLHVISYGVQVGPKFMMGYENPSSFMEVSLKCCSRWEIDVQEKETELHGKKAKRVEIQGCMHTHR